MASLYENYTAEADVSRDIFNEYWRGQTFTVGALGHTITSVNLLLYRSGSQYPGTLTVSIRATDVDGHPTGSDLTVGTTDADTLPGNVATWREIALTEYTLAPNTKYAIVLRTGYYLSWRGDQSYTAYDGGMDENSSDSGVNWGSTSGTDLLFEVWGNALTTYVNVTESGAGAEVPSLSSSPILTDSGAGVEAAASAFLISSSDSVTGTEILAIAASIPATDSGAGVDAKTTLASFTVSDSGGLSYELAIVPGYPFITESGISVEVFSKQFDVFEEALGAEFAWRQKGSVLIDTLAIPHVLSIQIIDDAAIVDKQLQGGLLPRRKMVGKPGRVVEIVGWGDSQSEIDALEALVDGTARTFYHPSGDSFAVLVTGFNPDQSADEYDRRAYKLSLVELR